MSLGFLGPLLSAALVSRPRHHSLLGSFLGGGAAPLLSAPGLLSLAGLAAAGYQMYRSSQAGAPPFGASASAAPVVTNQTTVVRGPGSAPLAPAPPPPGVPPLSSGMERIVRLALAAARSDGVLGEEEYSAILARAREIGAEALVQKELTQPRALPEIVAGVIDPTERADLYTLAFGIVRVDGDLSAPERSFLRQLAELLALDAATIARLEADALRRLGPG